MKYAGLPTFVWMLYASSFRKQLIQTLHFDKKEVKEIVKKAKIKYKEIILNLPIFEKEDEFETNIVSCVMLSAFILNMKRKPTLEEVTSFYSKGMMNGPTRFFCRMVGEGMFGKKDIKQRQLTAKLKAGERNPYSWCMEYLPYADDSGYECRFSKCGICSLMKDLGVFEYTPAMCHLDYDMNEEAKVRFIRKYTLASGGPYCDCGYKKK